MDDMKDDVSIPLRLVETHDDVRQLGGEFLVTIVVGRLKQKVVSEDEHFTPPQPPFSDKSLYPADQVVCFPAF